MAGAAPAIALSALLPNPSHGSVHIEYTLPRDARVRVAVLDVLGRERTVLADGVMPAGQNQLTWNGWTPAGPAPAGLYFVRCQSLGTMLTRAVSLVR